MLLLSSNASSQQLSFSVIGADQGLPSAEMYWVLQDHEGYMWFATNNGVSRYNGKQFTTFTTAQGLTDNAVLTLCEDHAGRIWFGPQNNELCYWYRDTIYRLPVPGLLQHYLSSAGVVILQLFADKEDNIWINTNGGAWLLESKYGYTTIRRIKQESNCLGAIKMLDNHTGFILRQTRFQKPPVPDSAASIWLDSPTENKYIRIPGLASLMADPGFSLVRSKDKRILFSKRNRLFIISPQGEVTFRDLEKPITRMFLDADDGLWVGFFNGGISYFKNMDLTEAPVNSLGKYTVGCVFKDKEGGVWATTMEHGLFYCPNTSLFYYPDFPLLDDHIILITALKRQILAMTFAKNIFEADTNGKLIASERFNQAEKQFSKILALQVIRDTVYISYGHKAYRLDQSGAFLKAGHDTTLPFKDVIQAADGRIWLIHGGGIVDTKKIKEGWIRSPFRITCATAANGSDLYIGSKSGLYLFKDGKFNSLGYLNPLLNTGIADIKTDSSGNLWIASIGSGVLLLHKNLVTQFTASAGLPSTICSALEIDWVGHVWVGTPNGLSCILPDKGNSSGWAIRNLDKRNGLNSSEITKLCALGQTLWVGSMSGINSICIPEILSPIPTASARINLLQVNNKPSSMLLHLFSYDQNTFQFTLEGLTFSDRGNQHFRYRLVGMDTTWQQTQSGEARYANLAPGSYTFQAAVANSAGIWSEVPATYTFTLTAPFWKRSWFIIGEVLAIALLIYLIIQFRTRLITRKEEEKTRINKQLAEYQMSALRAQMNPHFIFNAMNSIQNFIFQKKDLQANDYLVKFSRLIRTILNNAQENEISLSQEMETINLYIELEQLRFEYAFDYVQEMDLGLDTTEIIIPALLLQPYVENAIWHGLMPLNERKGLLRVKIWEENGLLRINIADNGVGRNASGLIKKKPSHESLGMELNSQRVALFSQGLESVSVVVEDCYTVNNEAAGTTVHLTLPLIRRY